jgi:hypothetical protein
LAYDSAANLFSEVGRWELAARQHKNIAETCEQEGMFADSLQHYRKAVELFTQQERKQ